MAEPLFKRIDHLALAVRDLERSVRFYEDALGFRQYFEHAVPAPEIERIVYLRLGDTVLELMHMPEAPAPSGFHFCLEVADFDAAVRQLEARKTPLEQAPHPTAARVPKEQGWRRVVFRGPDGEAIELRG